MLRSKTTNKLTVLRVIAFFAIISFSFEASSPLLFADDLEIEIVDLDLEDDTESDDELNSTIDFFMPEAMDESELTSQEWHLMVATIREQYLEELPTPPPDCI